MMITTTMMMMVMDQFEDPGVVLCRPSRLISKVIAYVNMEVSCILHRVLDGILLPPAAQ